MNKMLWGEALSLATAGAGHTPRPVLFWPPNNASLLRHLGETDRGRPASQFWVPPCLPSSKASGPHMGPQTYLKGRQTQIFRLSAATELRKSWPRASTGYPDPRQDSGRTILFLGWGVQGRGVKLGVSHFSQNSQNPGGPQLLLQAHHEDLGASFLA